ncbi:hypothetical protein [Acinetobacter rathckeae]|uniref:hypothetical protein n=1 Tax=Acinetobacter rathckeae TaxID=2605272 RepID=UPI0018A30EE0|nr:hypothetical protein [Acinetobacter rathckeae]MBF7688753.1 hypothetical protein [Acinetobacter rathckeae]MBF7696705.1 hypothetical protein [Acinetobacter rathckeae]
MEINFTIGDCEQKALDGPLQVGWFLTEEQGALLFEAPYRLRSMSQNRHAKSASRCPAILQLESRYFVINCPYDLHLRFARDSEGKPTLVNVLGDKSAVRQNKLSKLLSLVQEKEWRSPQIPILQLKLPYCFVADEVAYITQLDAFCHYRKNPLPGTIFGGRFPIHIWPRPLMWAFEWHDTTQDLILKRGEPLFYCQFDGFDPSRSTKLIKAEKTPELLNYMEQISGVVNYVNQTFSLFKDAESVRPKSLLTQK